MIKFMRLVASCSGYVSSRRRLRNGTTLSKTDEIEVDKTGDWLLLRDLLCEVLALGDIRL